ncbi:HD domain-containing protein [Pseudofrankia saprophytica]|nr:HD domain-containing protein [Pseudofrankia saprophytica]OHV32665.1 metal-dependent phosphohydrolase [Pseudofrankia sp. EUN1h]
MSAGPTGGGPVSPDGAAPAEALAAVHALFDAASSSEYLGEAVSVAGHSLRTAACAVAAGAAPALVAAALLHDVGHMLDRDSAAALARGDDIRHEITGAAWLSRWFGPEVTEPVRLHVDAKRYLCVVDPGYYDILSPISRRTLAMQGGPFEGDELTAFRAGPYAEDAAAVRRWDDAGKDPSVVIPPLSAYDDLLAGLIRDGGGIRSSG